MEEILHSTCVCNNLKNFLYKQKISELLNENSLNAFVMSNLNRYKSMNTM